MTDLVLTEEIDGVLVVRINRADKKNAFTQDMYKVLCDSIERVENEDALKVVLFTGTETSFTAGNDLNDFLNTPPTQGESQVFRFLKKLATAEVPLVAAVNGIAVGVGVTMLLHCDLVYASQSAKLTMPFVNLALVPEAASSLILPRLTGYQQAAELLMLGEPFGPEKGVEIGLINGITSEEELFETALGKAKALAMKPPASLRLTKALLKGDTTEVLERMEKESKLFGERLASPEAKEAMSAILEKRAPDFSKFN
ncbi:MAG: enoyl-CoA hydratase [Rhodospirillales bacterium]|nr:enoyl-CoA hydratase [Rhodospirillales bacterium]